MLDPFCGSGTTLVECQRRGLRAVGVDLNPIACLISKVKTSSLKAGFAATANAVAADAASRGKSSKAHVPDLPRLDHWFTPEVQLALTGLTGAIAGAPSNQRNALRLALSSIVVRVSNQDSDTRYAAVRKNVSMADVFALFRRAAERIEVALAAREHPLVPTTVLEADVLSLAPSELVRNGPVGLVITSPALSKRLRVLAVSQIPHVLVGNEPVGRQGARNRRKGALLQAGQSHGCRFPRGKCSRLSSCCERYWFPVAMLAS